MKRYDHEEVRCDIMAEVDCDTKLVGEAATCCICAGHNCREAQLERKKGMVAPDNIFRECESTDQLLLEYSSYRGWKGAIVARYHFEEMERFILGLPNREQQHTTGDAR